MSYTELHCFSDYSFLEGASCCEELFAQARVYGMAALAITDRNTLSGIVRAHQAAKKEGMQLIVGCLLELVDGTNLLIYVPAQIVRDAKEHSVEIRPVCITPRDGIARWRKPGAAGSLCGSACGW